MNEHYDCILRSYIFELLTWNVWQCLIDPSLKHEAIQNPPGSNLHEIEDQSLPLTLPHHLGTASSDRRNCRLKCPGKFRMYFVMEE